ncbi:MULTISPECIES: MFS transporter [Acinetobacter]|uniref:MFS transporter n=1 Tax=Acinetobacter TaxID=469 RepID=UPI000991FB37|nr:MULTISPECIES: MFS transporter [Acinetobacter]MCL6244919.1 MFS transporter [Acinetobacter amyesii]OOV84151.1 MFS transporter [Acinetobacter sp. ANC 5600]
MEAQPRLTRQDKRTLGLSSLGGALEFYDFVIYVFYAKIISELFFPTGLSPFWAMLNTYGIFAAGYFFRPLGGVVMAHFGDLIGRKRLFSLSILLMALPTLMIGVMPTFESIGYAAPLLLLLMRVIQGIAIGGEIPAAWTFVSEHVPEQKIGIANGLLTAGLSLGILLGALMSLFISLQFTESEIHDWAWRIPFILGGIFGFVALYLRSYLKETPVFKAMQEKKQLAKELPVKQVLQQHKTGVVIGMLFTWFLTGCVVVLILAMPNLLTSTFGFERADAFKMQSAAIVMQMVGCILAGLLADRFGAGKVMLFGSLLVAIIAGVFYNSLGHVAASTVFTLYMLLGLASGTVGMVSYSMVKMFPAQIRFSGISFSYNLAYAIAGGITLPLVQWLSLYSNIGAMYYIWTVCLVTFFTAMLYRQRFEKTSR